MINTKKSLSSVLVFTLIVFSLLSFTGEKDSLHKRVFNISLDEVKDGVVTKKVVADKLYFKDGKVFSDFLDSKFGYQWIRYRINKDSVYIDSTDVEVRYLQVEASATNADNQTAIIEFESLEWDLDGVIKITKNDKIKRYYDFVGREKGGKPKKIKKKKDNKVIEVIPVGQEAKKVHEETIEVPKEKK